MMGYITKVKCVWCGIYIGVQGSGKLLETALYA